MCSLRVLHEVDSLGGVRAKRHIRTFGLYLKGAGGLRKSF